MSLSTNITKRTVIRGESFDSLTLHNKNVRANFVECEFNNCCFTGLRSQDTFWGASNQWKNCSFSHCDCSGLISPQNRFEDCAFTHFAFTKYSPCETTFVNTRFESVRFTALKAQPNFRNSVVRQQMLGLWHYPEISELDESSASVLLRECVFLSPRFERVYFNYMVFDSCDIQTPDIIGCSFDGIQTLQTPWWSKHDDQNPELQYIAELDEKIESRLGPSSIAHKLSRQCLDKMQDLSTHSEWFDYLLRNGLPDHEFDVIEQLLDETPTL